MDTNTRTFDASSPQPQAPDLDTAQQPAPAPAAAPVEPEPAFDALEQLRTQLDERDAERDNTTPVEIPGLDMRLRCRIDFTSSQLMKWNQAAMPANKRKSRKAGQFDVDPGIAAQLLLLGTCETVESKTASGDWKPITDPQGEPVTPNSEWLLSRFNQVDPRAFVRKLFGREADMIEASEAVLNKAGFGDDDGDDDADPLA